MGPELNFEHFIGRRDELAALGECFERAAAGHTMLLAISGDAGIGKSRLVREFLRNIEGQQTRVGVGHCLEHLKIPFLPCAEIVRGLGVDVGFDLAQDDPQKGAITRARSEARLLRLQNIAQALLTPHKNAQIAVIEDVHWADSATLGLLEYLALSRSQGRLLIILTVRSEAVERSSGVARTLSKLRGAGLYSLRLMPLQPSEITALIHTASPMAMPRNTIERIKNVSEGNPLFAEELLRAALDDGTLPHPSYPGIRATVLDRLYQLSEADQRVVVCASVIGRFFDPHLVAALAQRPFGEAVAALRRARNLQLVKEISEDASAGMLGFRHNVFAEVVYRELLEVEARNLHARVAKYLEAKPARQRRIAEIAYHYSAAGDAKKALSYNVRAGDEAMQLTAFEDAAVFYERSLQYVTDSSPQYAALCEKRAYAWYAAGVADNTSSLFSDALAAYEALGDRRKVGEMLLFLSRQAWNDAETPDGYRHARRAAAIFEGVDSDAYDYAMTMAATHAVLLGEINEAESIVKSLSAADPAIDARIADTRAMLHANRGEIARAIELCEQARHIAERSRDPDLLVRVYSNSADILALCGAQMHVVEYWHLAYLSARTGGYIGRMAYAALGYANSLIDAGRLSEAREIYSTALETGVTNASVTIQAAAAGALLKTLTGAQDLLLVNEDTAFKLALRTGESLRIGQLGVALAFAKVAEGAREAAQAIMERAIFALKSPVFAEALLVLGVAFGEEATMKRSLSLLLERSGALAHLPVLSLCRKMSDAIIDGGSAKLARLQSIGGRWAAWDRRLLQMIALLAGNDEPALTEVAASIGANAFAVRLSLKQPRRTTRLLTKRELEVARLLSNEASNKSIAETLGISERTVEHHVESILQRLGVRSRWLVTPGLVSRHE